MFSIDLQTSAFRAILNRAAHIKPPAPRDDREAEMRGETKRKIYEPRHCFRIDVDESGASSLTSIDGNVVAIFDLGPARPSRIGDPEPGSVLFPRNRLREIVARVKCDTVTIEDVPRTKKKKGATGDPWQVTIKARGDHFTVGTFDPALFFRERLGIASRLDEDFACIRGVGLKAGQVSGLAKTVLPFVGKKDTSRYGFSSALAERSGESGESVTFTATDGHAIVRTSLEIGEASGPIFPGGQDSAMVPGPILRAGALLSLADALDDPLSEVWFGTARSNLNNERVGFSGNGWVAFGPPGLGLLPSWESSVARHQEKAFLSLAFGNPSALLDRVRQAAILTSDASRTVELHIRPTHAIPLLWTALSADNGFGAVAMPMRIEWPGHAGADPMIGYQAATLLRLLRAFPADHPLTMVPADEGAPTRLEGGNVEALIAPMTTLDRSHYPTPPEFAELEASLAS